MSVPTRPSFLARLLARWQAGWEIYAAARGRAESVPPAAPFARQPCCVHFR
jgi:hypothetical protein